MLGGGTTSDVATRKWLAFGIVMAGVLGIILTFAVAILAAGTGAISRDAFDDLVTGAEIARRLAISTRVSQLAQRPTFPRPLGGLGHATIWRWADIERWAQLTDRLPTPGATRAAAAVES